jgi:hypothetical protein
MNLKELVTELIRELLDLEVKQPNWIKAKPAMVPAYFVISPEGASTVAVPAP